MIKTQTFSTIGKNAILQGNFKFEGNTHLFGNTNGEILVEGEGDLILEIGSVTNAIINCYNAHIYGDFHGEIKALGKITLYPSASVTGKMIAKTMEILPGAVVNINGHTNKD